MCIVIETLFIFFQENISGEQKEIDTFRRQKQNEFAEQFDILKKKCEPVKQYLDNIRKGHLMDWFGRIDYGKGQMCIKEEGYNTSSHSHVRITVILVCAF